MRFFIVTLFLCLLLISNAFSQVVVEVQSISLNAGKTICAKTLMSDSSVRNYCWGKNVGRVFNSNTGHSSPAPIQMNVPQEVTRVFVGGAAAYGMTSTPGLTYSWGNNSNAELGQQSTGGTSTLPLRISILPEDSIITNIVAGQNNTCATDSINTWCWGRNDRGQLGAGYVGVAEFANYLGNKTVSVSTKNNHICAVQLSGKIYCAGSNDEWQLGNTAGSSSVFRSNLPETTYTRVGTGYYHTCAIFDGGKVKCWGLNDNGQLGGGFKNYRNAPVEVVGLTNAISISVGRTFSCALNSDHNVVCWGSNEGGQLGTWEVSESLTPRIVPGLGSVSSLSVGDREACAISNSQLYCWGNNAYGQLGQNDYWDRYFPVAVNFNQANISPHFKSLNSGPDSICSMSTTAPVRCWGVNDKNQLGVSWTAPVVGAAIISNFIPMDVKKISMARSHTCFIANDDKLFCWGDNGYGELGNGTFQNSVNPVEVVGLGGTPIAVSAGTDHTCAILSNGQLKCWGANWHGQLGIGTGTGVFSQPQLVPLNNPITQVSASVYGEQTCAVDNTGKAYCWGSNYDYEVGQDNGVLFNPAPLQLTGLTNVSKIFSGKTFGCAIAAGKVYCWGSNWGGQTGGGDFASTKQPRLVRNLSGIVDVQLGETHACALSNKKKLYCWGAGYMGQLGNGQWANIPSPMQIMSDIESMSVSRWNTCVLDTDENPYCWGDAANGFFGFLDIYSPVNTPQKLELKK